MFRNRLFQKLLVFFKITSEMACSKASKIASELACSRSLNLNKKNVSREPILGNFRILHFEKQLQSTPPNLPQTILHLLSLPTTQSCYHHNTLSLRSPITTPSPSSRTFISHCSNGLTNMYWGTMVFSNGVVREIFKSMEVPQETIKVQEEVIVILTLVYSWPQ